MADSFSLPEGGKTGKGRGNVKKKCEGLLHLKNCRSHAQDGEKSLAKVEIN